MENTNIVEMTETEKVKPYELKTLSGEHIVPMVSIIRKIGLKELKSCISEEVIDKVINLFFVGAKGTESEKNEAALPAIGVSILPTALDVAEILLANIEKAETDIFRFLESISNLTVEEVKALPLADVAEMILDIVTKEEFKDFYKVVSRFFK